MSNLPWKLGADNRISNNDGLTVADCRYVANQGPRIVQAVNEREPLREMLFRALVELSYVQSVENCESGLCASAEGAEIVEEGIKLLGVKDLSEDALKGEHNAD